MTDHQRLKDMLLEAALNYADALDVFAVAHAASVREATSGDALRRCRVGMNRARCEVDVCRWEARILELSLELRDHAQVTPERDGGLAPCPCGGETTPMDGAR